MTSNPTIAIPDGPPASAGPAALMTDLILPEPAAALLAQARDGASAVQALREHGFDWEAVRALANLLPVRRAVWWAVLSAWHGCAGRPAASQDRALAASVAWLREATEANRSAAAAAAGDALLDNAAGSCACAAGLAGVQAGTTFEAEDILSAAAMAAQAVSFAVRQRHQAGLSASYGQLLEVGLDLLLDPSPLNLDLPSDPSEAPPTSSVGPKP
jgi:hypothetical protein